MTEQDQEKKIDELLKIIKEAPALNGGFDKLSDSVNSIQECNLKVLFELQNVKEQQNNHTEKLDILHNAMYEPDKGLFRRVATALDENRQQTEDLEKLSIETKVLTNKVTAIEAKNETLENVAGKDFTELHSAIIAKKHMSRAAWAVSLAAIGGLVKIIFDIFS